MKEKGKGNGEKETGKGNHKVKWKEKKGMEKMEGMEKGGSLLGKDKGKWERPIQGRKSRGRKITENGNGRKE